MLRLDGEQKRRVEIVDVGNAAHILTIVIGVRSTGPRLQISIDGRYRPPHQGEPDPADGERRREHHGVPAPAEIDDSRE